MHQTEQQAASGEASSEAAKQAAKRAKQAASSEAAKQRSKQRSSEASGDVGAASFFYLRSKESPHYKSTLPPTLPLTSTILNYYFLNTSIYKYSKLKSSSKLQKESSYITIAM